MHYDDNFEPYWLDEKDWLVEVIMLPKDEDLSADLEYMGKLLAFSLITNTQMIAQIGDPNEDLPHLRPLSYVFPKHIVEHITNIALMVQMSIGVPRQESN